MALTFSIPHTTLPPQVVNLVPAADASHRWYKDTFPHTYPKGRRALLPWIW